MVMHSFSSCDMPFRVTMSNFYHSSVHLLLSFHLSLPYSASFGDCLTCSSLWCHCDFLSLMWLLLPMLCPIITGFFIFRVPVSCGCTWPGSMCKVHATLQDPQAVSLMLHKMAFRLSGKLVVLHLDNSTV